MNSLRARLLLGFALVALLPLGIALPLFAARIQALVRVQAEARLDAAVRIVRSEFQDEESRLAARLATLARDPQTRRLFLVAAEDGQLREFLAQQRALLGLDYLGVVDSRGRIAADAATAPGATGGREPIAVPPAGGPAPTGPGISLIATAAGLALDGSASISYGEQDVGAVRGGVRIDSTFLARLGRASGVELCVSDARGQLIATTRAGVGTIAPADTLARFVSGGQSYLARAVPAIGGGTARFTAFASTASADDAIDSLRRTAWLLALAALALAVLLAVVWSRQVSQPVERLAAFSERIARGEWDEPLAMRSVGEVQTLVEALERMRGELRNYRERLRAGERQAAYGQIARQVAHEIRNPLTPIAVSVADLRRSFELRRPEFPEVLEQATRTIDEEVRRLKSLLEEFAAFGKLPSPRLEPCDLAALLADLRSLYAHDSDAGRTTFAPADGALRVRADRDQLRQALVNLVQNGLEASAAARVEVSAVRRDGAAEIVVSDDGPGLTEEQRARLFVPGYTTKPGGSGIGLALVERIVSEHGGTIAVEFVAGHGAVFRIRLPLERGA